MIANGFYPKPEELKAEDLEFICFGLPRSGSTLVYQFVSSLYRRGVAKVHKYCPQRVRTVASYRDFRDVVVSQWRVSHPANYRRRMTVAEVEAFAGGIRRQVAMLERYRARKAVCLLRYEDFAPDPSVIFSALESHFGIPVAPARAARLIRKFSIDANQRIAARFDTFGQHDPGTQIHGLHIYKGEIGGWRDFVSDRAARRLEQLLKPALEYYGYEM